MAEFASTFARAFGLAVAVGVVYLLAKHGRR